MKNQAEQLVAKKIGPVESEQGAAKEAGSDPHKNYGHGSAKSEGTSGQIPNES